MTPGNSWLRPQPVLALICLSLLGIATTHFLLAQTPPKPLEPSFDQIVKPFLKQNCGGCHNADLNTAGVNVEQLDAKMEDRHLAMWESIRRRVRAGTLPPKGQPQPPAADRD